jgi:hypothetical protein
MSVLRILPLFALCTAAFAANDPARIASITEVCFFPVQESATLRFSDEHGVEWRVRLSKGEGKHWSVALGPVPKEEGEMSPVVEQSGAYRKKLLVMLSDFCSRVEASGSVSRRLLPSLKVLADEILKEPNQSSEPTPTAGTSAAEQPLVPAAVVAHL